MKRVARKRKSNPGKLTPDRQRHIVGVIASILRQGEPTHFAFEAACRHGLRIRLIFAGVRWADADRAALEIVAAALRQIGARRPTWYQGQPAYTEQGYAPTLIENCKRCHKPLPDPTTNGGWNTKFCSNACRRSYQHRGEQMTQREYTKALKAASEVKRLEKQTTCGCCGVLFVPKKALWPPAPPDKPRFCSNSCSRKHTLAKQRQARGLSLDRRRCQWCSKMFKPIKTHIRFCSITCANRARHRARKASAFTCEAAGL